MKKLLFILGICSVFFANDNVIKIGVTPYPTAMILENVKDIVESEGYKLEIIEFDNYIVPNYALNDGELDANFTQSKPFIDIFNKERGTNLVGVGKIFVSPMGAYSNKLKNIKDLQKGAIIYIPSDSISCDRALELLTKYDIIGFSKDFKGDLKSVLDISYNPLNLTIKEVEAPQLTRTLSEGDLSVINTNYALVAGLNPIKNALIHEDINSKFINVLAVRSGDEKSPKTKALLKAMQSEKMREFLNTNFKDVLLPSF
ncbi:MetQ/NlpA family ABC transporter substrate-binding protein [Campylobacter sp. MG1]|uniref:MetQ/NlpA family ABC transporter substrate-binding protein n=1 Tax=Campylobacter sp. MG1 TaxID=2976332 RepID=UPI00226C6EA5|nr:MetQ/NlpA family ABC transporter substrate-binding protein [Campylobacter sp. MG1]